MAGITDSFQHFSAGPVLVSWATNQEAATPIGYSMNGVDIQEQPFHQDLKNDAFGGMAGMPSDVQYLGSVAIISANLNRFDAEAAENLSQLDAALNGTDGVYPPVGSFVKQDGLAGVLVLSSPVETRYFYNAYLVQGRAFNTGVPERVYRIVFRCLIDDPCEMALWSKSTGISPCTS